MPRNHADEEYFSFISIFLLYVIAFYIYLKQNVEKWLNYSYYTIKLMIINIINGCIVHIF